VISGRGSNTEPAYLDNIVIIIVVVVVVEGEIITCFGCARDPLREGRPCSSEVDRATRREKLAHGRG
jgi:hypothetical protein